MALAERITCGELGLGRLTRGHSLIVEPFVCGVKRRNGKVQDPESADRPMSAAGRDIDGGQRLDGVPGAVQFDFTMAFEDDIDFRHSLVIMRAWICCNVDQMHARGSSRELGEGASCDPARTRGCGQFGQMDEVRLVHGSGCRGCVR
jgi:hypothetical protein